VLKAILAFLLIELIQFLLVIAIAAGLWKWVLKDRLPKAWVENLTMMGFVPGDAA